MTIAPRESGRAGEPGWRVALVFVLLLVGLYLTAGPLLRLSQWHVPPKTSPGLAEARAWRAGGMSIPAIGPHPELGHDRPRDTAYRDGKVYNVFPPLFSFLSYAALVLQSAQAPMGGDTTGFYAPWFVALVALPLPVVGFWAFRTATGRSEWAAVMTAYWILGTPLFKMLVMCQGASTNELHHVFSNAGLMLLAGDLLGRRRIWPAALGLIIGLWTRQLTGFYLAGMVWIVWRLTQHRWRGLATAAAAAVIGLGALGALNWAKFGSPLDTGYMSIYEGREDMYARRAREYGRTFDVRFVPRNLYFMNVQPPEFRLARMSLQLSGHGDGTSIWLTSPLLLFALRDVRRWWRDPARRALMLSSVAVIVGFLCYHTTGSVQRGFYRFALDFAPVWLVVIAPYVVQERRRWITVGCLTYSALYFHVLCATGT